MRFKNVGLVLLVAAVLAAAAFTVSAGEGEKTRQADQKEKAKPVNPFLAAAGQKGEAEKTEPVTLSNKDIEAMPPGEVPENAVAGKSAKDGESLSFSNDDLKEMFGEPSPAPDTAAEPSADDAPDGVDPLEWLEEQKKAAAAKAESQGDARQRVAELEQRVKDLEAKLLTARNPLLSRRVSEKGAPEGADEEEKAAYDAAGAASRVEIVEKDLEKAKAELREARQELRSSGGR